jgi:hypothetical protein
LCLSIGTVAFNAAAFLSIRSRYTNGDASANKQAAARVDQLMQPYRPDNARVYAFCAANMQRQRLRLPAEVVYVIVVGFVCVKKV